VGNVSGYVNFTPSPNWSVQLNPSLTDGQEIKLTFRVSQSGGPERLIPYSLFVAQPVRGSAQVNFRIGEILADRMRNLVYVVDDSGPRIFAVDTTAGNIAASAKLAAQPGWGRMALSPDGNRLYVALTNANQVQVFNVPSLEEADLLDVGFPPVGLAAATDGKLYASAGTTSLLRQIDPITGKTLASFGRQNYNSDVLELSGDGRSLFLLQTGVSGVGRMSTGNTSLKQTRLKSSGIRNDSALAAPTKATAIRWS